MVGDTLLIVNVYGKQTTIAVTASFAQEFSAHPEKMTQLTHEGKEASIYMVIRNKKAIFDTNYTECPHGGDNTDCDSCAYGLDYSWDSVIEDCLLKNE